MISLNQEPSYNPTTNWGVTLGRVLFNDKALSQNQTIACASCHRQENAFADTGAFSTGFLGGHTDRSSIPYMHDGRFETLEEVIEHYNSGVKWSPTLDDRLTTTITIGGPPVQMNMTSYEKQALVVFLHTLTDQSFVTDPKFSDPFVQ